MVSCNRFHTTRQPPLSRGTYVARNELECLHGDLLVNLVWTLWD